MLLRRMRLKNFKAFEDFTLHVTGDAFLLGPNNAGKTTVLSAARLAASLLQTARVRHSPSRRVVYGRLPHARRARRRGGMSRS